MGISYLSLTRSPNERKTVMQNQNLIWLIPTQSGVTVAVNSTNRHLQISGPINDVREALSDQASELAEAVHTAFADLPRVRGTYEHKSSGTGFGPDFKEAVLALSGTRKTDVDLDGDSRRIAFIEVAPDEARTAQELGLTTSDLVIIPVAQFPGRLVFGPVIGPNAEITLADRVQRRISVAPDPALEREIWANAPDALAPGADWMHSAVAIAVAELERDFPGFSRIQLNTLEVSGTGFHLRWRPLHALPTRGPHRARRDIDSLVDEYQGVIVRTRVIKHHDRAPRRIRTVQADVAQTNRILPWPNNVTCQGSSFDDVESARRAAIGESVERYCGNILSTLPTLKASYDELISGGLRALNPQQVVLHSDDQYAAPGFPLVRFTHDLVTSWVPGKALDSEGIVWLPKSFVFVNYHSGDERPPLTNVPSYPGISGGSNWEMAVANGIEETVERHATMVWWHNAIQLPRLVFPDDFRSIWEEGMGREQKVSGVSLPNKFGLPVMAAIVEDTGTGILTIGFGARPDPRGAFLKALTEAFTLQEGSRDMLLVHSNISSAIDRDEISSTLLKDWRADRKYSDSYRSDYKDISDLMAQQQLYLDPAAIEKIRPLVSGEETVPIDGILPFSERSVTAYRNVIEAAGYTIFVSDITSHDVRAAGMIVTRTIIPGLIPNFPAAFPHLGDHALQRAAMELGLVNVIDEDSALNYAPLPHA